MTGEKSIKITKKDGSSHIVPASQRATYEAFNEKNKKLKKDKDIVTIEDYVAPAPEAAAAKTADSVNTATNDAGKKTAVEVVELINKATTVEEVNALAEGDGRVTVIKAAEAKTAELTK